MRRLDKLVVDSYERQQLESRRDNLQKLLDGIKPADRDPRMKSAFADMEEELRLIKRVLG